MIIISGAHDSGKAGALVALFNADTKTALEKVFVGPKFPPGLPRFCFYLLADVEYYHMVSKDIYVDDFDMFLEHMRLTPDQAAQIFKIKAVTLYAPVSPAPSQPNPELPFEREAAAS